MRNLITILLLCTLSWSCKKDKPEPVKNPAKAVLTFPAHKRGVYHGHHYIRYTELCGIQME